MQNSLVFFCCYTSNSHRLTSASFPYVSFKGNYRKKVILILPLIFIAYIRYASLFCLDSIPRITKTEYNQNDVHKASSGSVSDNNHPLSLNCITHPKSIRRWGRLFFRQLNHSTHPCACLLIFRKKQTLILRPLHLKWGRTTGVAIAIIV